MSNLLKAFGIKARYFNQDKNITQEKLGELANIHRTYIGQIEAGKKDIVLRNIKN